MCAKKQPADLRHSPSLKVEEVLKDEDVSDEDAIRILRASMTWKEWFRIDFLRYWYFVAAFALNVFTTMEIRRVFNISDIAGAIFLIVIFSLMSLCEYLLYKYLWPEGILTKK